MRYKFISEREVEIRFDYDSLASASILMAAANSLGLVGIGIQEYVVTGAEGNANLIESAGMKFQLSADHSKIVKILSQLEACDLPGQEILVGADKGDLAC